MNNPAIDRLIFEIAYPGACLDHDMIYDANLDGSHCVKCKLHYKAIRGIPKFSTDANAAIEMVDQITSISWSVAKAWDARNGVEAVGKWYVASVGRYKYGARTPVLALCGARADMAGRLAEFEKLVAETGRGA